MLSVSPPSSHVTLFTSILILPTLFWTCLFMYLLFPITSSQVQCLSYSELTFIKTPGIEVQCLSVALNWTEASFLIFKASNISHYTSLHPIPAVKVLLRFGPNKQWANFVPMGVGNTVENYKEQIWEENRHLNSNLSYIKDCISKLYINLSVWGQEQRKLSVNISYYSNWYFREWV